MTAQTDVSPRRERSDGTSPQPSRLRGPHGPVWMTLRVHRASLWGWAAFAAVAAGVLLWLHDTVATQAKWNGCGTDGEPKCPRVPPETLFDLFGNVIALLPFAAAVYAAGVLVARDMENGTARLAWTQSVTPARWLAAKLGTAGALIAVNTVLLTLLFRQAWTVGSEDVFRPWHQHDVYLATGAAGLAHTVLGLAVGALAGVLVKRTLPAMGLAAAALLPVYLAFASYRYALWPRVFRTSEELERIRKPVQAEFTLVKEDGTRVPDDDLCFSAERFFTDLDRCLDAQNARDFTAAIHPESHYWPLQFVEAGLVLALAAVVAAVAFRLLRSSTGAESAPVTGQEASR